MATIHIPEAEAARNFAALMAHVNEGSEVIIERNERPIAVVRPVTKQPGILLSEAIALAKARGFTATIDEDFARDVAAAIEAHREPLDPPAWD
jgi:antitoxin (DNA-binding transcriptional repressor) of toxin-antitoxin stability system